MGQHFLRCQWVVSTLIKAAGIGLDDTALEIGPGTGILTRALAQRANRVVAIEKDQKLAEELRGRLLKDGITNVKVVTADVLDLLKFDFNRPTDYKVVANIPYYLTSRLLRLLLEKGPRPETIVLTIQKEVAQRIAARPPKMSILAVSVQAYGKPEIIKTVPRECFSPRPEVESAIIKISEISGGFFKKHSIDEKEFFGVIRRAFSQKRKTIAHTLRGQHPMLTKALEEAGISPQARPQELGLEDWAKIVKILAKKRA